MTVSTHKPFLGWELGLRRGVTSPTPPCSGVSLHFRRKPCSAPRPRPPDCPRGLTASPQGKCGWVGGCLLPTCLLWEAEAGTEWG